jgi:hypothetical protein
LPVVAVRIVEGESDMDFNTTFGTVAALAAAVIALATLVKSGFEYVRQGTQKRAEYIFGIRNRFLANQTFRELCDLLETDDLGLKQVPFKDKRDFLNFFDDVALMLNSGLMKPDVCHYMFGYYAIRCRQSVNFWYGLNKEGFYWKGFFVFADGMLERERRALRAPLKLRF